MPSCIRPRPVTEASSTRAPVSAERAMATIARIEARPSATSAPRIGAPCEHGVGEALDLAAEEMAVGAERLAGGRVALVEDLDLAGAEVPGVEGLRQDRAVLAVELEALVPVHAHGDGQVEMAERAAGELGVDEPAIGAERSG